MLTFSVGEHVDCAQSLAGEFPPRFERGEGRGTDVRRSPGLSFWGIADTLSSEIASKVAAALRGLTGKSRCGPRLVVSAGNRNRQEIVVRGVG